MEKKLAVITGDLIGSSKYRPDQREAAINTLRHTLEEEQKEGKWLSYEIYRGDSVQIEVNKVEKSLELAILLRAALKKLPYIPQPKTKDGKEYFEETTSVFSRSYADIRISIGIGKAEFKKKSIVESDGEAYRLSGRSLDMMKKKGQQLIVQTADEDFNQNYEVQCKLLDVVIGKWSAPAAEVVYWLLKGLKDVEIAEKLGVSQPAISSRKKAAGWEAIELMIQNFESRVQNVIKAR